MVAPKRISLPFKSYNMKVSLGLLIFKSYYILGISEIFLSINILFKVNFVLNKFLPKYLLTI